MSIAAQFIPSDSVCQGEDFIEDVLDTEEHSVCQGENFINDALDREEHIEHNVI